MAKKFELRDVIAIGRTFDEYCRMFNLTFTRLKGVAVLDAGGGVSSFTAEANGLGLNVKSADRIYGFSPQELESKSAVDLAEMLSKIDDIKENYNWDFYGNSTGLAQYRENARAGFIADYKVNRASHYVKTSFPWTVFTGGEFDITIMSHLLFLYDEHLDYEFHADTVAELLRITREEVMIYPLFNLRWKKCLFVDRIMGDARFSKSRFTVKKSGFEFVKGANEYLSIMP
jgi:hypothetical protein